jgi:DNA-binding MarR family transcriptional regulator
VTASGRARPEEVSTRSAPVQLVSIPGYLLRRSQAVHNALWGGLVPGDLTGPQYAVLSALVAFPDSEQQRIAVLASLDKTSATDVVARLVRKGWIYRERDRDDGRRYLLSLTPAAAIALSSITPLVTTVQDALLAPLQPVRRIPFIEALAAVARFVSSDLHGAQQVGYLVPDLAVPGHLIRRAQQVHTASWAEILDGQLTGPQYAVLHVIDQWPGINQRRLGELAALDKSTTADIVNRLAGRGWIDRERDPDDGRGRILALTTDAIAWLQGIHRKVDLVQQHLLEPLQPGDRSSFLRDLARVAFEGDPPEEAT